VPTSHPKPFKPSSEKEPLFPLNRRPGGTLSQSHGVVEERSLSPLPGKPIPSSPWPNHYPLKINVQEYLVPAQLQMPTSVNPTK